jgi:CDP-glycerol glycerophosphotransferase (TagB/SpsB family)
VKQILSDVFNPDIIFYQEPYKNIIDDNKFYKNNLTSLFCYAAYGFHWNQIKWILNKPLLNLCWQVYYENDVALRGVSSYMSNGAENCVVTGLPMADVFQQPISNIPDPWKNKDKKKRIIWAPHYTVLKDSVFCYSTFLSYCDYMLNIAEKYHDTIQIAFKPHPVLLTKLYDIWGKDKTDSYYAKWRDGSNTQLELGEYVGLFMHSDAMIHDCGTFMVEYHYTKNPVLYLLNGTDHNKDMNEFGRIAFDLHYKGRSEEDIEAFINKVIEGKDDLKEAREKFFNDYLLPPDGNSASDNIIKAILGE